mgnify:CR=1 FL=1
MRLKYYTVVQKQSFRTLRKDKKNDRKRDAKRQPKWLQNRAWAFSGPISEVLGGFDRGPIFDDFWSGPKNEKN